MSDLDTALPWLDALKWDEHGMIPAIAQDAASGRVLMFAWMNRESLEASMQSGNAVYWSRSRQRLWRKGEESGHTQRVIEMRVDCDRDCLLLLVDQAGPACHTNRRSCFYTALRKGDEVIIMEPQNPSI